MAEAWDTARVRVASKYGMSGNLEGGVSLPTNDMYFTVQQ